jgi:hypothetical protein
VAILKGWEGQHGAQKTPGDTLENSRENLAQTA